MYKNRLTKDTMTINDQTRGVVVEALNPHVDRLSVGSRVLLLRAIDPSRRRQWGLMFPGRAHSDQGRIIWSRDSAFRWGPRETRFCLNWISLPSTNQTPPNTKHTSRQISSIQAHTPSFRSVHLFLIPHPASIVSTFQKTHLQNVRPRGVRRNRQWRGFRAGQPRGSQPPECA
jgi:hypothetical protein